MKYLYVYEKSSLNDAEHEAGIVLGESMYRIFKSSNTRHLTLAFPVGENPLEYLNRYWSKITGGIAKTIGVELRHIAILGYVVVDEARKKPHAHLLVYSRKERKRSRCWKAVSKVEIGKLVDQFQKEMQINLKVTPFFYFPGWVDYITGHHNLLANGFTTIRIPTYNPRILRSAAKRKGQQSKGSSQVGRPSA